MSRLKFGPAFLGTNLQPSTTCPLNAAQLAASFIESKSVLRQVEARKASAVVWHG